MKDYLYSEGSTKSLENSSLRILEKNKWVSTGLYIVLTLLSVLLLSIAYLLEDPYLSRGLILLMLSLALLGLMVMLYIFRNKEQVQIILMLLAAFLLIMIEYYSKYAINYLYHVLYFIVALMIALAIQRKIAVFLAIWVSLASFLKFIQLIYIEPTRNNIMTFIFFLVVQILLITMVFIVKAYSIQSQKAKSLYRQLLVAYKQLNLYAKDIERLSAKEERSSIARDLHDSLGHDLTGLIMELELSKHHLEIDYETGIEYLNESIDKARSSLTGVRAIVDTLKNQEKLVFASKSIRELVDDFSLRTGLDIDLDFSNEEALPPDYLAILYWVIQESLTNIAKHSSNKKVKVKVEALDGLIGFIVDDYRLIPHDVKAMMATFTQEVDKGNGLIGMDERLARVDGLIDFTKYIGRNSGFRIRGRIPWSK